MKTENLEELEEMRKEFESADALLTLSSPSKKSGTYKLYICFCHFVKPGPGLGHKMSNNNEFWRGSCFYGE